MGNQQAFQKNKPLTSNKVLIVGKGIYSVIIPQQIPNKQIVQALNEGLPKFIRLQIYLKDANNEIIPANPPTIQHPQFTFPLANNSSFSFNDYHYFLPNLENLTGLSIIASLDVPLSKESRESYVTNFLSYIGAQTEYNSHVLGYGYVDLKALQKSDIYHSLTVPIIDPKDSKIVAKIDCQIVKPGIQVEINELENNLINYETYNVGHVVNDEHVFFKSFERFIPDSTNITECRRTKLRVEQIAQKWMNDHVNERIKVVSIDTTHTKSSSSLELYTTNVWYKFKNEFIIVTHQKEKERKEKALKEAEELKKKEEEVKKQKEQQQVKEETIVEEIKEEDKLTDSSTSPTEEEKKE
ncbi:hypothetical protein ABK040_014503 [Willaertia magna]